MKRDGLVIGLILFGKLWFKIFKLGLVELGLVWLSLI